MSCPFKPGDKLVINWEHPINNDIQYCRNRPDTIFNKPFIFKRINTTNLKCCYVMTENDIFEESYYIDRFMLLEKRYINTQLKHGGNI